MPHGATVYDWIQVVRRARLGRTTKGVALILASYADPDGTRVFPGIANIAVAAEVTYNTAQNAVACLRRAGLIELVAKSGRRDIADEYRLIIGAGLLEQVEVLDPNQFRKAADRLRRGRGNTAPTRPHQQEPTTTRHPSARGDVKPATVAEPVDIQESATERHPTGRGDPVDEPGLPEGDVTTFHATRHPTARAYVTPRRDPPHSPNQYLLTNHDQLVVRTGLTVVGDPQPAARASPRCPHGNTTRRRRDGTPRCVQCHATPTQESA